mgnify:CR=1 FL=1
MKWVSVILILLCTGCSFNSKKLSTDIRAAAQACATNQLAEYYKANYDDEVKIVCKD